MRTNRPTSNGTAGAEPLRNPIRPWLWLSGLTLLWLVFATVFAPWVIRQAYSGRGFDWLSGALEGRAMHPLELYLGLWRRFATIVTAGLGAALAAGLLLYRFAKRPITRLGAFLGSEPTITARDLLLIALAAGMLAGLAEGLSASLPGLLGDPREARDIPVIWLAPVAASLAALVVAASLMLVRMRARIALRVPVFVFAAAVMVTIVPALHLGIGRWGVRLLAIGAAVQLSTMAARHAGAFRKVLRATVASGLLVVALVALVTTVGPRLSAKLSASRLAQPPAGATNVILLILDTVRAQSLGLYGYHRDTTPQIDRIARDGVTFDMAIAPAPWTLPSHASMMTGLQPWELSTDFDRNLDGERTTLAEVLRARGYATAAFVANYVFLTRASGLDRGFLTYEAVPISLSSLFSASRWTRSVIESVRSKTGIHAQFLRKKAAEVNAEFLSWLDHRPDRPFFALLNYFDAHGQYESQPPFDRKFRNVPPRYWLLRGWERDYTKEELAEFKDAYDSSIAYLDDQIGALFRELDRRGILRNTILVIASDHGEHIGEHGIMIHANSLYMPLLHVPLVFRFPGAATAGVRVERAVSLADIPATILDLLGGDFAGALPGRSLAPLWASPPAGSPGDAPAVPALSELTPNDFANPSDPIQRGQMASLVWQGMHYIRNGDGVEELYDLATDPLEERDIGGQEGWRDVLLRNRSSLDSIRPPGVAGAVAAKHD